MRGRDGFTPYQRRPGEDAPYRMYPWGSLVFAHLHNLQPSVWDLHRAPFLAGHDAPSYQGCTKEKENSSRARATRRLSRNGLSQNGYTDDEDENVVDALQQDLEPSVSPMLRDDEDEVLQRGRVAGAPDPLMATVFLLAGGGDEYTVIWDEEVVPQEVFSAAPDISSRGLIHGRRRLLLVSQDRFVTQTPFSTRRLTPLR